MTKAQKRAIEEKLNWLDEYQDFERNLEVLGIKFTLDVLGYWTRPTENGYEIRKK